MTGAVSAILDEYSQDQRRKEWKQYIDFFSRQLFSIYVYMPAPVRVYHHATGEWELINDPIWQDRIDKLMAQQQLLLQKQFPEFYEDRNEI